MRHLSLLVMAASLLSLSSLTVNAQKNINRCGTMDWVNAYLARDQAANTRVMKEGRDLPQGPSNEIYRTASTVYIPVVVHIVLQNPYRVTDADVQQQIDKLNKDFSGFNADSTNGGAFMPRRGHSNIQFCLAKRTPDGQFTSGIERRSSATMSDLQATNDPIKFTSMGGLNAWDTEHYLNFWVGNDANGGVLGYAQFPGSGSALTDGVFINIQSWGSSSCYTVPPYNSGRTLTHEVGHYFGLFHIWGDENGCTGDDFRSLSAAGSSFSLPTSLYNPSGSGNTSADIGDTPNQGGATSGCPSGTRADDCSGITGRMYQNFMDYSSDGCLSLFTIKQVARMEYVLDHFRSGLKSTDACSAPASTLSLDAAPQAAVNPGGFDLVGCNTITYPHVLSCEGNINPKMRIINNGLNTITSITAGYILDNGAPVSSTIAVNLTSGSFTTVSLPAAFVAAGNHEISFFTSDPNGSTDMLASNDTLKTTFIVQNSFELPLVQTFEDSFPGTTWNLVNSGAGLSWIKKSPGRGSSYSMFIDNYRIDGTGSYNDYRSPKLNTAAGDSIILSFDLAHQNYGSEPIYWDTLSVMVSTDCGQTFTPVYKKYGPALATAGSSTKEFLNPPASAWRKEVIGIGGAMVASGNIIVAIRNGGRWGNNIFIDNINIRKMPERDLVVEQILSPASYICSPDFTPKVRIRNNGANDISSYKISYSIDNGPLQTTVVNTTLAKNQKADITLNPASVTTGGVHSLVVYSYEPYAGTGSTDMDPSNDTLRMGVSLTGSQTAPLSETFQSGLFPPANWGLTNQVSNITWQYNTAGQNNPGSAFVNSFNLDRGLTNPGNMDELVTPAYNFNSQVDSVVLSFDMAAAIETGKSRLDTLEILLTTNCGQSYTSVYKKGGFDLQTIKSSIASEFSPTSNDQWRNIRLDLSAHKAKGSIQLVFRATTNHGNNIFLDNVNMYSRVLPANLKENGYVIFPNPVTANKVTIWHYQTPNTLSYVNVYDMSGRLVYTRGFKGDAQKVIDVNLTGKPAGVYMVHLGYTDNSKNVSQRIIKN